MIKINIFLFVKKEIPHLLSYKIPLLQNQQVFTRSFVQDSISNFIINFFGLGHIWKFTRIIFSCMTSSRPGRDLSHTNNNNKKIIYNWL